MRNHGEHPRAHHDLGSRRLVKALVLAAVMGLAA
jgi:hypothetical protein